MRSSSRTQNEWISEDATKQKGNKAQHSTLIDNESRLDTFQIRQSCFEEIKRKQRPTYQSPKKHDTSVSAIRPNCNDYFKQFMKLNFVEWYADKATRALDDGQDLESITRI